MKVLRVPMTTHTFSDSPEGLGVAIIVIVYYSKRLHSGINNGKTLPKCFPWAVQGCCSKLALVFSGEL